MSFHLFTILLLVPLVFADPAPVGKILFDGSDRHYILTENFHPRRVEYWYYRNTWGEYPDRLKFEIKSHDPLERSEFVDFSRDLANEANLTFAIDIYPYTRGYRVPCFGRSSKSLKDRINCNGNVAIRDTLTDKEKQEIEKFKKEHKRTGKQFEITYDRRQLNTAAAGQKHFRFIGWQKDDEHSIRILSADSDSVERWMWLQDEALKDSSFVIEGLPGSSGVDCYGTHRDLVPIECRGDITIKDKIFPFPG